MSQKNNPSSPGFLIVGFLILMFPLGIWLLKIQNPNSFIFQIKKPLRQLHHMQMRDAIALALAQKLKGYLDVLDILNRHHLDLYQMMHSTTTPTSIRLALYVYLQQLRKKTDQLKKQLWFFLMLRTHKFCETYNVGPCYQGTLTHTKKHWVPLNDLAPFKDQSSHDPKYLEIRHPEQRNGYIWLVSSLHHQHWLQHTSEKRSQALLRHFLTPYFSVLHIIPDPNRPHRINVSYQLYSPYVFLEQK